MLDKIYKEISACGKPEDVDFIKHFFRAYPGGYGEGDEFIAARVPELRKIAKKYFATLSLDEFTKLIQHPIHEYRLTALFALTYRFEKAKTEQAKEEIAQFYMQNLNQVNNWDLVDTSAHKILGPYLFHRDHTFLYNLAHSGNLWHQRIAVLTTFHFIKNDHFEDALAIAKILLTHPHDLIHKAVGWMLREIGNRAVEVEIEFLNQHYKQMPRTMLRYAIEKFVEGKRQLYLKRLI